MIAHFDKFELNLTKKQAQKGSHQGACDDDVAKLLQEPGIIRQFAKINPEDIRKELEGYGAWDDKELSDDDQNKARILWIACGNLMDEINGC